MKIAEHLTVRDGLIVSTETITDSAGFGAFIDGEPPHRGRVPSNRDRLIGLIFFGPAVLPCVMRPPERRCCGSGRPPRSVRPEEERPGLRRAPGDAGGREKGS